MKWDAKNGLLALFLCLVFVLVVGYGACSFGGEDMKSWQKILIITSFAVPMLCISILIGHQIWFGEKQQTEYTRDVSQQVDVTIQKNNSLPQKLTVTTHESTTKIEKTK